MPDEYTISQLARAADVPISTVRYYERVGLLKEENRSPGNYRLYGDESLVRLRFIRAARSTGFTLDNVATLLACRGGSNATCRDVQILIERRLTVIEKRLADLRHVSGVLKSTLKQCRKTETNRVCQALDQLEHAAASGTHKASRK